MKRVDLGKLAEEITYMETYCVGDSSAGLLKKKRQFRRIFFRRKREEAIKAANLIEYCGKPRFRVRMRRREVHV